MSSLKDLYVDELGDLYDAETQMIRELPRLVEAAHAPELRDALARHCEESRLHLERLQLIFTRLGERTPGRRCAGLAGIVQEADERLNQPATPDARDAAIIGVAQRIEHYEIAGYGCARTYARRLNRGDEARLLQETLDEEGRADHRLSEIAEAHVVDDARSEAELQQMATPAPARRLRYIDVGQLDYRRLTPGSLDIRNEDDEPLGSFDGLVVDAASNEPRYVIVRTHRVIGGRRYLLPVGELRFDAAARVLRADLDKALAARYPAFDRDEFERMSDEALRGYESRLLDVLPHGETGPAVQRPYDTVPEWLMTGVWITVPHDHAEALPEEARSFANEFVPSDEQVLGRTLDDERERRRRPDRAEDTSRTAVEDESKTPPRGDKLRG